MRIQSRPYLTKTAGGEGFEIVNFLALCLFVGVIALWLYSAKGIVGTLGRFVGLGDKNTGLSSVEGSSNLPGKDYALSIVKEPTQPAYIIENTINVVITPQPTNIIEAQPTYTLYPTYTPYPENIVPDGYIKPSELWPENKPLPALGLDGFYQDKGEEITLKLSYYWPPLGGINCDIINGFEECRFLSNGLDFRDFVGKTVACPVEFDLGDIVCFDGYCFVCQDRGGAIVKENNSYWIDILYPYLPDGYFWSQEVIGRHFSSNVWSNGD